MCGGRLVSPAAYLVVTTPGRGGCYSGCSGGVTLWRLGGGEAGCSSLWLTRVYFTVIRFVLVNGSRDSAVPICIRVVGMYMLVETTELTPDNVDGICIVGICVWYVWSLWRGESHCTGCSHTLEATL
jgi:hypothetical protein